MTNVVAIKTDALADLANKINVCASKSDDYRVTAACHLAKAKALCVERGITFKEWVADNIKFSLNEAYILARCGEASDPAKAIADLRAGDAKKKRDQRTNVHIKDNDYGDIPIVDDEPGDDAQTIWRRGLINRSLGAVANAQYEDWSQFAIDDELLSAVKQAAAAWKDLATYLEGLHA
jgi:hypothetical protein